MNTAIIVAAGSGIRFSTGLPKQFVELLGKPLLVHTLERFEACASIDEIVLVLSIEGRSAFTRIRQDHEFSKLRVIVTGGQTRAESAFNGLKVVNAAPAGIIVIHDGARPLVSDDEIVRTVERAIEVGAACLVGEVTDTIKQVDGERISCTVDRYTLRRALTPQAFRYDVICRAFDGADLLSGSVTDECYLVEKLGVEIAFVEGSSTNIKITRPEDLILAAALLKSQG